MPLPARARLGPYEILGPLGAGGMGEVYRARDPRLAREVAIKVLPPVHDADQLRRLEHEARVTGTLEHPNILAIHDVGTEGGSPYVVSELLEGTTLRERLRPGPLPLRKALDYAVQIAHGLAAAHERRVVHRDVKPDNVFVTKDGRIKILDFGLAVVARPTRRASDATGSISPAGPVTEPGQVLGTAGYMAPEQVRGQRADQRADIFAFGAVLYEMLSGKRAFHGDSAVETMSAILKEEPPDPSTLNPEVPAALERLVKRCLEKDRDQRFQSMRDVAFDLEAIRDLSGPTTQRPAPTGQLGRGAGGRRLLTTVAVFALAASYAAVFQLGRRVSVPHASYHRITFRPGVIGAARLAPDGHTLVYSAAWEGRATELFSASPESPESRSLGLAPAEILAISSSSELAIAIKRTRVSSWAHRGTLARVPLAGGVPREVIENVEAADWAPDGQTLAVVREVSGRSRLEMPVGRALYEAPWISHPRVSPRGDLVAFLDHPLRDDDRGAVAVVDAAGVKRTLAKEWSSVQGLAWSPDAREVWFTASDTGPGSRSLLAVTLSGRLRMVESGAGGLRLHDVAADGRVLLSHDNARRVIMGLGPGETRERDLSWLDWSVAHDLSPDGRTLLFGEEGQGGGAAYSVCLRRTDGSPALRLGEGDAIALSPDGKWVLTRSVSADRLVLLPTGPGEPKTIQHPGIREYRGGAFFPDGGRLLFNGKTSGTRAYVHDLASAKHRALTPEGTRGLLVSPDGESVLALAPDDHFLIFPLEDGEPRLVPGISAAEFSAVRFSADGRWLYVSRTQELPARVFRIDLATGRLELWKEIVPPDPAGVVNVRRVLFSADGRSHIYDYRRFLSDLYLVDGLR